MQYVRPLKRNLVSALVLSGVLTAQAQTYQWNSVKMGGGGFVSGIITCKNERGLMYARTDVGGAYRWDTTRASWVSLLDWASSGETSYLGVESLAIDPNATNRLYMLVGVNYFNNGKTAILRSNDYGKTFTITDVTSQFKAHGNGMGRQNGERLQVDPNNSNVLYCGTRNNGLFRSFNAGATWSNVGSLSVTTTPNGNGICFVVFDAASKTGSATTSQTIYVGVSKSGSTNLYVSKDGGSTFAAVPGAPTNFMPQRAVLSAEGFLYVTYANGGGPNGNSSIGEPMTDGAVWKYNTTANQWTNITPAGYAKPFCGISINPANPKTIVVATINTYLPQYTSQSNNIIYGDRILKSTDGGTSWADPIGTNRMNLDANGVTWVDGTNIHWVGAAEIDPADTSKVWVSSGQGIFSCANINAAKTTWKFNVTGLEETVPLGLISIPGGPEVSVIGDYDGFRHTDITNYAPRLTPAMGSTSGIAYAAQNSSNIVRLGGKMYYSTDQGLTWIPCDSLVGNSGKVAVSANAFTFLHCPSGSVTTYRSINKGVTWAPCSGISVKDALPVADMVNADKFYVYNSGNGEFLVSTDRGQNFTVTANVGSFGSKLIRAVPGYEGDIWVALYGGGLKRSTNSGGLFSSISNVTNCSAVGFGKAAIGNAYPTVYIWGVVGGVEGVYRSTDQGANWTRINDDAHEYGGLGNGQFIMGSMNIYGRVFMSTAGRGIVYGDLPVTTAVNNVTGTQQGSALNMSVFPNPVVANVVDVNIESGKTQSVALRICNTNGALIQTKKVSLQQGANKITFNDLLQAQSGVYVLSAFSADGMKQLSSIKFVKQYK